MSNEYSKWGCKIDKCEKLKKVFADADFYTNDGVRSFCTKILLALEPLSPGDELISTLCHKITVSHFMNKDREYIVHALWEEIVSHMKSRPPRKTDAQIWDEFRRIKRSPLQPVVETSPFGDEDYVEDPHF